LYECNVRTINSKIPNTGSGFKRDEDGKWDVGLKGDLFE
jgi:hypothetical protein